VDGATEKRIQAGELRVNLLEAGQGEPVLLLHGWPQHNRMWLQVMERLAPRYRLLAPDLRGFGSTEAPGQGYDGETFARDQIALLDALEIERVKVIGHDWGGWTAMLLGIGHPERVERMLVLDAPHPWPRQSLSNLTEIWRSWYAGALATPALGPWLLRRTDFAKGILTRAAPPGTFTPADLDSFADSYRAPERARAINSLYRYYHRTVVDGLRGRWRDRRLAVPTLLIFGARDLYVTPKLVDGYQPYADEMRAEVIPDTGHFLVDERPELISDRAVDFFG
jgi:pimeloyl-ACP methyl ester carboxylesterase